jgi:hypothetical protein
MTNGSFIQLTPVVQSRGQNWLKTPCASGNRRQESIEADT